jgi:hypothetical protein
MMLWTIDFGSFGIALAAGIDRSERSHVSEFFEKHGDHSVQHIAIDVGNLEGFLEHTAPYGMRPIGEIQVRDDDGFGPLKQLFAPGYHDRDNPSRVGFDEYVERPAKTESVTDKITFSGQVGTNLYRQAQQAMTNDDRRSMLDFSLVPADWQPVVVSKPR